MPGFKTEIRPEFQRIEEDNFYEPLAFIPKTIRRFFVSNIFYRTLSRMYGQYNGAQLPLRCDADGKLIVSGLTPSSDKMVAHFYLPTHTGDSRLVWGNNNSCGSFAYTSGNNNFCGNNLGPRWEGLVLDDTPSNERAHHGIVPINPLWDESDIYYRLVWAMQSNSSESDHTFQTAACAWSDGDDRSAFARTWNNSVVDAGQNDEHMRMTPYQALNIENSPAPGDVLQLDTRRTDSGSGNCLLHGIEVYYLCDAP